MSVRSRITEAPVSAVKAYGGNEPPAMALAASDVSRMDMGNAFAPGQPVGPYAGYSQTPRAQNYVTGYNISARPRTHERVSFETLSGLIDNYDVAQIAIWHRIDSIRSLDWKLVAADHFDGDVTDAIPLGMAALDKPDRIHYFETWLGKWLWDELAYGAGALYRLRNRAGRCVGLLPVDGRTIAPLLDYWGNPPGAMAAPGDPLPEAYVQYVNGLPWEWLTRADMVYEPYRLHNNSVYGRAPIESVILNANTDIRFQVYFLQRFTEGNLPAAFAAAPDTWTPDDIEAFQLYWDGFMYGDQSRKHQVRWMPGGTSFAWSDEKDFSDVFSLFLMRKTAAAYHVTPSDLGFTENVNKSSGESQADVQHRVGDLPFIRYIQRILSGFLQDDLSLPLRFTFDLGEEQADRIAQAQADKIYVDMGAIGVSDIREMRYGLAEPEGQPVPRYIFTERAGPIPLSSLYAVAGRIDPASGAPLPGAPLPREVFGGTEGTLPNPPIKVMSLAEREFGPAAMPPAPPPQPKMTPADEGAPGAAPVAKEGETAGITSETGIYGDPLIRDGDEDDEDDREAVAKAELAAFRRFARKRRQAGEWRDFAFAATSAVTAHRLNDAGRLAVRKAAGEIAVAGLAVLAEDTGRVLMLQRALDPDDPAAGKIEFPGGHLEGDESPLTAAWREWSEETGAVPAPGTMTGQWTAGNGVYRGIVWTIESESLVPVRGENVVPNPDDPDGDQVEAILWVDPADLEGNPLVRDELAADMDLVMAALGRTAAGGPSPGSDAAVAKAGEPGPEVRDRPAWHGWELDQRTAAHWGGKLADTVSAPLADHRLNAMAGAYLADHPAQDGTAPGKLARNDAADAWITAWLAAQGVTLDATGIASGLISDGYLIGAVSAASQVSGQPADTAGWEPGDGETARDVVTALGAGAALAALLASDSGQVADGLTGGVIAALGRALAAADATMSAESVGYVLAGVIADGELAAGLSLTQISVYTGMAAHDYYLANATGLFAWVTDPSVKNCPVCVANAAADPRPLSDPWPSGDDSPPSHPRCRCAVVPAA